MIQARRFQKGVTLVGQSKENSKLVTLRRGILREKVFGESSKKSVTVTQ
jgi:hypothetical protein